MKYIKNLLLTVTLCSFIVFLSGCSLFGGGQDNTIADAEGNMLKYSLNDLYSDSNNGFFVRNKDNTFSPVMAGMGNYNENNGQAFLNEGDSADRFIWFADTNKIKFKNVVPVVTSKTPLVGFFKENSDIPEEIVLEKFDPLGFTIGMTFNMAEDQSSITMNTDSICANSTAASFVEQNELKGEYEVVKFNESDDVPISNIDDKTGLLLGLEKNKKYQIGYYDGTVYHSSTSKEFALYSDTRIFRSMGNTDLDIPFTRTDDNYFVINFPNNLEEGYYYINDFGLFKYEP